jgi:hypothetical protein
MKIEFCGAFNGTVTVRPGCSLFRLVLKARKARGESEAEARDAIHRPL